MNKYIDVTRDTMAAYRLAKAIEGGHYSNIIYFEFHRPYNIDDPVYDSNRLSSFQEKSNKYYENVIG